MKHKNQRLTLKDTICCFCAIFLLLTLCDAYLPISEAKIYNSVIRLHIIANSDSEYDQSLKLLVRDEIKSRSDKLFKDADSIQYIESHSREYGDIFTNVAKAVIEELGADYSASYIYGFEHYPTREYDGIMLPEGTYRSFRVILGGGEGKNWWCVLFPIFCTSVAASPSLFGKYGFKSDTQKTFAVKKPRKYIFRFKILEFFSK